MSENDFDNYGHDGCAGQGFGVRFPGSAQGESVSKTPIVTVVAVGDDFPVAVGRTHDSEFEDPQFVAHSGLPRTKDQPLGAAAHGERPVEKGTQARAPGSEMDYRASCE